MEVATLRITEAGRKALAQATLDASGALKGICGCN
jgi:hypothetical protein